MYFTPFLFNMSKNYSKQDLAYLNAINLMELLKGLNLIQLLFIMCLWSKICQLMLHVDKEEFPVWAYAAIGGSVLFVLLIASSIIVFCRSKKHNKKGKCFCQLTILCSLVKCHMLNMWKYSKLLKKCWRIASPEGYNFNHTHNRS